MYDFASASWRDNGRCDVAEHDPKLKDLLKCAETWPGPDQEERVETAREIESRRTGSYVLDDREWSEIQQGIAEADRGEFVSEEDIAAADTRRGI
jgi:hypothetical protein